MIAAHSHKPDVDAYIAGVMDGSIVTNELVRCAVERHLDDLEAVKDGTDRDIAWGPQSEHDANHAIDFIGCLHHSTGEFAGLPFILSPWQKFIVWSLVGWKRKDGARRFRDAFISVARGNGKSPLGAALALYFFAADEEARAEVYVAATKKDQAKDIVFAEAVRQVRSCQGLRAMINIQVSNMAIIEDGSKFEPLGSEPHDGMIIHCVVRDELHAWREEHRKGYEKIETAMSKRRQPIGITITTAGDDQSDLWAEQYDFSCKVVQGVVQANDHFSLIYQLDEKDDDFDESCWIKANPNLGISVQIEGLRSLAAKAKVLPTAKNAFRRYHTNRQTVSFYKIIPPALWKRGKKKLTIEKGDGCHLGFDWGWKDDIASLAGIFPKDDDGRTVYQVKSWNWIPEGTKRDLSREPWATWISDGHLVVTDGDTTDTEAIYSKMDQLVRRYEVRSLAFDPNNAREFATKAVNEWMIETFEFFQTCRRYNECVRLLLAMLQTGRFWHGGNPVLTWAADNLTVKEDSNGYIMPAKAKSKDKIDPMVAAIMALSEAKFSDDGPSVYEEKGSMSW